jgi:hypothetical protein
MYIMNPRTARLHQRFTQNQQVQGNLFDFANLADERFQNLFAKAETHQRKFRPKETVRLESQNRLTPLLQERTLNRWRRPGRGV